MARGRPVRKGKNFAIHGEVCVLSHPVDVLWWLVVGHFVADFPLQSDFIAREKNPWQPIDPSRVPPGQKPTIFWPWVLTAHAVVHGGAVTLATGSALLGLVETVCHWFIDLAKCANLTSLHIDQSLHLACKVAWFLIWWYCCR
jgi:hypothetical protein